MSVYLSVVIPAFNEKENLERGVLEPMLAFLKKQAYTWEVIISDDGSTDGSTDLLQVLADQHTQVRILKNPHRGKAATVTSGMLKASGSWRLFTDFDQSTPISEVTRLFERANKGIDIIIGSREMVGARRDKEPWYRHLMGRGFNLVVQLIAVPGILDTQCGFKLFSAEATERLFPKLYVYGENAKFKDAFTGAFDVELLFLALQNGFSIREVPITWHHVHTNRVSPIKDSIRMFRDILKIRVASAAGKYSRSR